MSSKFLDRLDEIREGAPARMGFGPSRSQKTPGMALVLQAGPDQAGAASGLSPDAVVISGAGQDQIDALKDALSKLPWGVRTDALGSGEAQAYRDAGADLLAFQLSGTSLGAVASKDSARVLCVDPGTAPEDLRDINALPVDAVLVPLGGSSSAWTLQDLVSVARVSGRVGKNLLAEITEAPDGETLEVLRNAGIIGLVLDVSAGEEAINGLKEALLNMPRPGADQRGTRSNAILPGAVYSAGRPAQQEEPDEDD
jgi:hypothetical protein